VASRENGLSAISPAPRSSSIGARKTSVPAGAGIEFFSGQRQGLLFVAPSLILFAIVLGFPIVYAGGLSFFKVRPDFALQFSGLQNFRVALASPHFWNAVANTGVYTIASVLLHLVIGLGLALVLNNPLVKGRLLFRIALLLPWTLSFVVTGVTWRWIFNAEYGVLNAMLRQAGVLAQNITWLGSDVLALPAVIAVNVWRGYPFMMVMAYAGLQLVPAEQREAAMVDGASALQSFRHVTLPNLRPVLVVAGVLDFIWVFIQFDLVQVMTQGGPARATELLSNLIYREAFEHYEFGLASAIAILMLAIVLVLSAVYVRILDHER
jgi:ABC-type sugar transport system permease subunit